MLDATPATNLRRAIAPKVRAPRVQYESIGYSQLANTFSLPGTDVGRNACNGVAACSRTKGELSLRFKREAAVILSPTNCNLDE